MVSRSRSSTLRGLFIDWSKLSLVSASVCFPFSGLANAQPFWHRRGTIDAASVSADGKFIAYGGRKGGTGDVPDRGDLKLRAIGTGEDVLQL